MIEQDVSFVDMMVFVISSGVSEANIIEKSISQNEISPLLRHGRFGRDDVRYLYFFLLRFRGRSECKCEIHHSYEFLSILEPFRTHLCCILASWIGLGLCIFEIFDRFRKGLQKQHIITSKSKESISGIYPIFSEHCLRMEFRGSLQAFEEVGKSVFRGRHDLDNFTRYIRIFIEAIDGTESMISISNDDLSIDSISYEEEWRKWEIFLDLVLILLHM